MQYKAYARQTLNLIDTGAIVDYKIDKDYIVMNNSILNLVHTTDALQGDFIAIIKTSGAYDLGCITAVDNKALTISYKDMKEMFNDNMLNPLRREEAAFKYEAIGDIQAILNQYNETNDIYKRLKLQFTTAGQYYWAVWDYTGNSVNIRQYLIDCFDRYNIILQFRINFNKSGDNWIVIHIMNNMNTGELIKDNIYLQTLTFSEQTEYENTTAIVIDKESKDEKARYYLLADNTITSDINHAERALPVRTAVVEWDSAQTGADPITSLQAAESVLKGKAFNHYVESQINRENFLLDIARLSIGDAVKIVTAPIEEPLTEKDPTSSIIDSVYTGMKENSDSELITLIFGKARKNYTDKIQLLLRRGIFR